MSEKGVRWSSTRASSRASVSSRLSMDVHRSFIRNGGAPELLELFLIASVGSVLGIRGFLAATGYPQVGGSGLHIAHMLWGGLFMLVALVMLLSLMGIVAMRTAAILGGIGFGTFIDELGKFITSDNDYFFHPTIGLIYVIFVVLALLIRSLRHRGHLSQEEALANALNILIDAADGRLDADSQRHVLALLSDLDQGDPVVRSLAAWVERLEPENTTDVRFYFRTKARLIELYGRVIERRVVLFSVLGAFVFFSFLQVLAVVVSVVALVFYKVSPTQDETFVALLEVGSATLAALMVLYGAIRARTSRLVAYRWFERATLLNIFVTHVFRFFESELAAIVGLALTILVYMALRFMIQREEGLEARGAEG